MFGLGKYRFRIILDDQGCYEPQYYQFFCRNPYITELGFGRVGFETLEQAENYIKHKEGKHKVVKEFCL